MSRARRAFANLTEALALAGVITCAVLWAAFFFWLRR